MKPQNETVLSHLKEYHSITPMEALTVYGISRLAAAIYDLRKSGHVVGSKIKHDAVGHRYTRYVYQTDGQNGT